MRMAWDSCPTKPEHVQLNQSMEPSALPVSVDASTGANPSTPKTQLQSALKSPKQKRIPPPLPLPGQPAIKPLASPSPMSPRKSMFKKNIDDGMDKVLEQVGFERIFGELPQFNPDNSETGTPLAKSPRDIITSYRRRRLSVDTRQAQELEMKEEIATASPRVGMRQRHMSSSSECGTPKTPKSGKVDDRHFFGSNFNLEMAAMNKPYDFEVDTATSPRTPKTPSSPGAFSSLRRILDQRRTLVMQLFEDEGLFPTAQSTAAFQSKHQDVFPSKVCLQLKIREVRQKMMAETKLDGEGRAQGQATSASASSTMAAGIGVSSLVSPTVALTTQGQKTVTIPGQGSSTFMTSNVSQHAVGADVTATQTTAQQQGADLPPTVTSVCGQIVSSQPGHTH